MRDLYKEYLFQKHYLIAGDKTNKVDAFCAAANLASSFGIIVDKPELANLEMTRTAAHCLGEWVPEPFYRGFPQSVREMTPDELLFDQMLHYTETYGLGWWNDPGHSIFEKGVNRESLVPEDMQVKEFKIIDKEEAEDIVIDLLKNLMSSNRPLNLDQLELVRQGYIDFGSLIIPDKMPCKDTVIRFVYTFKDAYFFRFLMLSDVIKLVEYIQYSQYNSENIKKLNLKNQDRKLITRVIDWMFENKHSDWKTCMEKQAIWCGLLHHIHYKSVNKEAKEFVYKVRSGKGMSVYSDFEREMDNGRPVNAARILKEAKGQSALLRNLNYILSRCETEETVKEVLACLE